MPALILLAALSSADAHPFGSRYAAARAVVEVREDAVHVDVHADIPYALLTAMARDAEDPVARVLDALPAAVTVTIDGEPVPTDVVARDDRVDLVDGHARILHVSLRAPADLRGSHRIDVTHGVVAATPAWLWSEIAVPAGSAVRSHSLAPRPGDPRDLHARWTRSRRARTLAVEVDLPDDALSRRIRHAHPPVAAPEADAIGLLDAWRAGRPRRDTGLLHLALGALLAAAAATSRPRTRVAAAALVAVIAVVAAGIFPVPGPSGLVLAVPLLLAAAQRAPGAALVAVALACTLPGLAAGPALGLPVVGAAALGALAGLTLPVPRAVAFPVAALAAIALAAWGR